MNILLLVIKNAKPHHIYKENDTYDEIFDIIEIIRAQYKYQIHTSILLLVVN